MQDGLLRIGCGAGFGGDRLDAAVPVVRALVAAGGPAALMFETLAERTLALAQMERSAGGVGYDRHLTDRLRPILSDCLEHGIKIIGNFGAADPFGAAEAIALLAVEVGARCPNIHVVTGDDLMTTQSRAEIAPLLQACVPEGHVPISANVYLGAGEIADALKAGADIVVTGRVSDPSLALGPIAAHFNWDFQDLDRLAAGTLAGHLLECGGQVTGGYFADPGRKDVAELECLGFPIVEIHEDGTMVVTKPADTGGAVTARTVKEQMLYEIHDPSAYLTPDVVLDMSDVVVLEIGPDRVAISGARGLARPSSLKATVCYDGGMVGEGEISYAGRGAAHRAMLAAKILRAHIPEHVGLRFDLIGVCSVFGDNSGQMLSALSLPEEGDIRLRMAVRSYISREVDAALHELGALYTCGPAGGGGVRSHIRNRVSTSSALIPRKLITPSRKIWPKRKAPE